MIAQVLPRGHQEEQQQLHQGRVGTSTSRSKSQPLFFLALLLVAVLMSVSNIRGAVKVLPISQGGAYQQQLEMIAMMGPEPPKFSSSSRRKKHQSYTMMAKEHRLQQSTSIIVDSKMTSKIVTDTISSAQTKQPILSTSEVTALSLSSMASILLREIPNNENTVISLVSMGKLVDSFLVERCIRSIRTRGKFSGYILVFTDEHGYEIYQQSRTIAKWDDNVKIVKGWDEDLSPMENVTVANDQAETMRNYKEDFAEMSHKKYILQPKRYAQKTMIFKRFKTLHAKYIAADPDLRSKQPIRFVLYIDCDNLIGKPLEDFFQDYANTVRDQYEQWRLYLASNTHAVATTGKDENADDILDFGFFSMFRDKHLKGKMHSGVIFLDLLFDDRCTRAWRKEMDEFFHGRDQTILLNVIGNYSTYKCKTFVLPQQYFSFANKHVMSERNAEKLPTFIHVTEYRLRRINEPKLHREFFEFVLDLKDNKQTTGGISQEQLVSPWAVRTNKTIASSLK